MTRHGWSYATAALLLSSSLLLASPANAAAPEKAGFGFGKDGPAITRWLVAQPFSLVPEGQPRSGVTKSAGFHTDFLSSIGGEAKARPAPGATVEFKGRNVAFTPMESAEEQISLPKLLDMEVRPRDLLFYAGYLYTTVSCDRDVQGWLHVGYANSCKVWFNGKMICASGPGFGPTREGEVFPVELKAGDNALLIKGQVSRDKGPVFIRLVDSAKSRAILEEEIAGALRIVAPESAEPGKAKIRVSTQPNSPLFSEIKAEIEAIDTSGKVVAKAAAPLGVETDLDFPKGTYRIRARAPGFPRRELHGESICFVGLEPKAEARRLIQEARDKQRAGKLGDYAAIVEVKTGPLVEGLAAGDKAPPDLRRQTFDLAAILEKAAQNPNAVKTLRGWNEWAYISKADGTAQPFYFWIPEDYDASRSYPLEFYLHGAGGTHLPPETPAPGPQAIDLRVLGRGTVTWYDGLAEVDVYEAMDYVMSHWSIDKRRIHLHGGSMGGIGTLKLGSRHPDWFTSGRIDCGSALGIPTENLLHMPIHSVHSADDGLLPILTSRAPLERLLKVGGMAVINETIGYGHSVWEWKEGRERAVEWEKIQTSPETVRRVHYTATDESARGAYWVEVVEWGPKGIPATIDARLGDDNNLYVDMKNVRTARIAIASSPADRSAPMTVVVGGRFVKRLAPPLSNILYIRPWDGGVGLRTRDDGPRETEDAAWGWMLAERPHFPGGAITLYRGEPLLIVYGTQADEATNKRMQEVAALASHSHTPAWPQGRTTMLGLIPSKADRDVADDDIANRNLMLIGTASQNSVVAKLAGKLPLKLDGERIVCNDGESWSAEGRAWGLLHYNPLAPKRLVFWTASGSPEFYSAGAELMEKQSGMAPPDFLLMNVKDGRIVAARRFDSRWNFETGYKDSPLLPDSAATSEGYAETIGEATRQAASADFALISPGRDSEDPPYAVGEARVADLFSSHYLERLCYIEVSGRRLLELEENLQKRRDADNDPRRFIPALSSAEIAPERAYRVALPDPSAYFQLAVGHPDDFTETDTLMREALERELR